MERIVLLTRFKKSVEAKLHSTARVLDGLGLEPNHLTAMSLAFSTIGFLTAAVFRSKSALLLFTILSGLMDALDGALARCSGKVTRIGAFLDSTIDRLSDALIIVSLIPLNYPQTLVLTLLVSSMLISYTRARAESLGVDLEKVGLIERPERIAMVTATLGLGLIYHSASVILLIAITVLSIATFLHRLVYVAAKLRAKG